MAVSRRGALAGQLENSSPQGRAAVPLRKLDLRGRDGNDLALDPLSSVLTCWLGVKTLPFRNTLDVKSLRGKRKPHPLRFGQTQHCQKKPLPLGKLDQPIGHLNEEPHQHVQAVWPECVQEHLELILVGARIRFEKLPDARDECLDLFSTGVS